MVSTLGAIVTDIRFQKPEIYDTSCIFTRGVLPAAKAVAERPGVERWDGRPVVERWDRVDASGRAGPLRGAGGQLARMPGDGKGAIL